jgi:hypothetical protein
MKGDGGGDEAETIRKTAGRGGYLGTMGETVEGGKEGGEAEAGGEREAFRQGDQQAEGEQGRSDHLLQAGGDEAVLAEGGGKGHHADEGCRNEPAGASTELGGPDTYGDHGEQVIETADGMGESA